MLLCQVRGQQCAQLKQQLEAVLLHGATARVCAGLRGLVRGQQSEQ
jgi:hypothetical protein